MSDELAASCLRKSGSGLEIALRVSPNASRTEAEGMWRGPSEVRLKLRVKAPPVEGKANEAVTEWCAETFGLRMSQVIIARGSRGKSKSVHLDGIEFDAAARILEKLMPLA